LTQAEIDSTQALNSEAIIGSIKDGNPRDTASNNKDIAKYVLAFINDNFLNSKLSDSQRAKIEGLGTRTSLAEALNIIAEVFSEPFDKDDQRLAQFADCRKLLSERRETPAADVTSDEPDGR
jgi:hypothetical protein